MHVPKTLSTVVLTLLAIGIALTAYSQQRRRGPRRGGGEASLQQDFRGIVANGEKETDLFRIASTGVSTQPVVTAAASFLASLSEQQRRRTTYAVDDLEWRQWDNRHFYQRQGVGFDEMDAEQRNLAFGLLEASLSARGLKLSQDIMKLNGTLAELANNFDEYGRWLYWITIMGEPSTTEPWGWQIDGHHLIINYFVLGDQVVMSPVFIGSEPVRATSGEFNGTVVMQDEQDRGLALIRTLDESQRSLAVLATTKGGNNALAQAYQDNLDLDYAGIKATDLSDESRSALLSVIEQYVGNMSDEHAAVKMSEVTEHLDRTYFAWIGGTADDSVFYYRIHSPVVLIEFDHQRRVAPFRSREPSRDHIHAVLRTPNGNDYGKDLLRQHYHDHAH
ncbi:MAG: DUF3500 domain-containing protein [Planctomycetota bacterium]